MLDVHPYNVHACQRDGRRGSHGTSTKAAKNEIIIIGFYTLYCLYCNIPASRYCSITWWNVGHTGEGEGEKGDDDKLSLEPHPVTELHQKLQKLK